MTQTWRLLKWDPGSTAQEKYVEQSPSVLVLGGRGFIGRHAVAALLKQGARVSIGSRKSDSVTTGSPVAPQTPTILQLRLEERVNPEDWSELAERFDVILNCVGILRQRRAETYDAVHHRAPAAMAAACAASNTRFVQVSALGLSPAARSRFLTSKWHGDEAILAQQGPCFVARLSLLDGEGGFGASWLRGVARLPLFVAPTSAKGKIAALTADDAGEALARLCLDSAIVASDRASRLFELGGDRSFGFAEYVAGLRRRYSQRPAIVVPAPGWLTRIGAHLCDLLHFSPFSFGHWELLCSDNVPVRNRLPELLGRNPQPVIVDR